MSEKKCLGHDRAILLQTITRKGLSEDTDWKISLIIRDTRLSKGSEAADEKAVEIINIINECKTEEEVIKRLCLDSITE